MKDGRGLACEPLGLYHTLIETDYRSCLPCPQWPCVRYHHSAVGANKWAQIRQAARWRSHSKKVELSFKLPYHFKFPVKDLTTKSVVYIWHELQLMANDTDLGYLLLHHVCGNSSSSFQRSWKEGLYLKQVPPRMCISNCGWEDIHKRGMGHRRRPS